MNITRPMLRYPGGKFRIAKWIIEHFPPHKFYVEPFAGAASVFFQKPQANAEIINDINNDIVNVFEVLRDPEQAERLEHLCRLTPLAYHEYDMAYEPGGSPVERARKTIFRSYASIGADGVTRNKAGFRGLKNYESGITTAHEWMRWPDQIKFFTARLQGVIIENRDAIKVIETYDSPETFVYADPPYIMDSRSQKDVLYAYEMGETPEEEEILHRQLADTLHTMKGSAIISGYDSPLYDELYADWKKEVKSARAQGNRERVECIWISPQIQPKLF